jgi:hypothetical protein
VLFDEQADSGSAVEKTVPSIKSQTAADRKAHALYRRAQDIGKLRNVVGKFRRAD